MAGEYKIKGLASNNPGGYRIKGLATPNPEDNEEDAGAYLDQLPEGESFLKKLPRNILIGLTHAGRGIHNLPHDIISTLEHLKSKSLEEKIAEKNGIPVKHLSDFLPYDTTDYSDVFGGNKESNTLMDTILQKGIEHAPEIIGAGGAIRAGLRRFPVTQRGAARQLKEAEKLIQQRGVNNFQTDYPILQEATQFLPKTHATGEMLQGVINGEYAPTFALQSQIGKHARDLAKSPLAAERLLAPQARELKQRILHEMEQALRGTGHHKEADLLKGGLEDYAKYMKFRENALPVLKKIGFPTTGLATLGLATKKGRSLIGKIID